MEPSDFTLPEIDYLAKDYASFRRLMLDHLQLRAPEWSESSAADIGHVLVEILAYAADYLSYYQDAVATEAYLGTARRRRSIKRRARLLDYIMHEGCNARVWVQVQVSTPLTIAKRTQLFTRVDRLANATIIEKNSPAYLDALAQSAKVFETMHDGQLFPEHNEIPFYAEDGRETIVVQGSTSAILRDAWTDQAQSARALNSLYQGQILVFEQVKDSGTGDVLSADPDQRHAVRVSSITRGLEKNVPVVKITWADEDALPFDLPVSTYVAGKFCPAMSVARGNIILADHGQTIPHEALPPIQPGVRYRPMLTNVGLTYCVPGSYDPVHLSSAIAALKQDVIHALPSISLFNLSWSVPLDPGLDLSALADGADLSDEFAQALQAKGVVVASKLELTRVPGIGLQIRDRVRKQHLVATQSGDQILIHYYDKWTVRPDLLSSGPQSTDYIVDVEEDGHAYFRFGFGGHGRLPQPGEQFVASYRIGTGSIGNVRADTIAHIVLENPDQPIALVRNPLPAMGGTDLEPAEDAQLYAPTALQLQQRCVTADDYTALVERHPEVLRAVTQLRWTGSWYTAFVYVQRRHDQPFDAAFQRQLTRFLREFQLMGYQLEVQAPQFVPLDIALTITLKRGFATNSVNVALRQAFSTSCAPGGQPGFFCPDNFAFGQPLYASRIVAAAMAVPGVLQVEVTRFGRFGQPMPAQPPASISIGPLEMVRLDNDPSQPQNGTLQFRFKGGV